MNTKNLCARKIVDILLTDYCSRLFITSIKYEKLFLGFIVNFINCIGTFVVGPQPALVWSMYADTADYGEWKLKRRTTALVFSTVQFSHKLGLAVGAGLAGIILGAFGFVANEVQNEESLQGIRMVFSILPAIFAVLSAVAIIFYKIDNNTLKQMEQELAERRNA